MWKGLCFMMLGVASLGSCCRNCKFVDLGDGYTFGSESKGCNYITGEVPPDGIVPPNVLAYNYDNHFIVAKQRPFEQMDDEEMDVENYWLVVKDEERVYGPMEYDEFVEMKGRYGVNLGLEE